MNKKEGKKSSKSNCAEPDNNSTLNRTLLADYDGVVYTLDAKLIGNIGRYFNHSCSPNIAVQNVFVEVSLRLPLLRFAARNYGKSIDSRKSSWMYFSFSWDHNYTVEEIVGRRIDCNCGSAECRRRVL